MTVADLRKSLDKYPPTAILCLTVMENLEVIESKDGKILGTIELLRLRGNR
jgi:hypothetical protein